MGDKCSINVGDYYFDKYYNDSTNTYGVLVTINGVVTDSPPNTIKKHISALCNNSFLMNEIE